MENAAKALIMAAGILIGILILSLAVYLFVTFGSTSKELHKQQEEQQLAQFNTQFTSYETKTDNTIYDVITVANLATENNRYYEFTTRPAHEELKRNYYICVTLQGTNIEFNKSTKTQEVIAFYNQKIANELAKVTQAPLPNYSCQVGISEITGRVYNVSFKQI